MRDEEWRTLERRWRETMAPGDELAYVQAMLRRGRPEEDSLLGVVALLGNPTASERRRPHLLSTAELAEAAQVQPGTVSKWVKSGCPRHSAEQIDASIRKLRGIRGKYVYDPAEVLAWRLDRVAFLGEPESATSLLISSLHALSQEAARRAALAAAWVAVLEQPEGAELLEEILLRVEAAVVDQTEAADLAGRRAYVPVTSHDLARAQAPAYLESAVHSLGYALGRRNREPELWTAFLMAYWSVVAHGLTPGQEIKHQYAREAPLARLIGGSFARLMRAVRRELIPWALGGTDPVAERVASRAANPSQRVVPQA